MLSNQILSKVVSKQQLWTSHAMKLHIWTKILKLSAYCSEVVQCFMICFMLYNTIMKEIWKETYIVTIHSIVDSTDIVTCCCLQPRLHFPAVKIKHGKFISTSTVDGSLMW